jgi:Tol biopolymer transport system component
MDTGEERRLTFNGAYNVSPAWSPTGEWIAHAAQAGNNFDIYLINPEGSFTTPLVTHPRTDEDPACRRTGESSRSARIAEGEKEIYRVDIDGSHVTLLTDGSGIAPTPGPGGSTSPNPPCGQKGLQIRGFPVRECTDFAGWSARRIVRWVTEEEGRGW